MKITLESPLPDSEDEIIIRTDRVDENLLSLIWTLSSALTVRENLTGYSTDKKVFLIDPANIYYFESVDDKVFAYGEQDVAELKFKLYELENRFIGSDFIRISKSMILNLSKVKNFAPYIGGRFEAILQNGEKVIISRQYLPQLKKRLGL